MKRTVSILIVVMLCAAPRFLGAQLTPWFQWTFLSPEVMDVITAEASGESAFTHVLFLGGMPRARKAAEFTGTLREAQYILEQLREYGLADAAIVRIPGGETWNGLSGDLWEVGPGIQKIASATDLRAELAQGSSSADVSAELLWVGDGGAKDIEGLDVKGKILVTSGPAGQVHNVACLQKGAEGVISFYSPRALADPLSIPWSGIRGTVEKPAKFAFLLPPREGILLRDRLKNGEKITVHAVVRAENLKYDQQYVVASLPGTDSDAREIILTAHLFEGLIKQDANDNFSGCAAILEAARTLRKLIDEGRLARPKRTIRFLWVPEISGSIAYVKAEKERVRRTLCNINLDMVGLRLTRSGSFFTLMRTSYGNPHYLNDVMENYYRYVGEATRAYVTNSMSGAASKRIVAPSGSEDPMYYYMGTHFGASDHEVFNDWGVGVPGVVMNTWPDPWYHTSQDRPDKIDPTQMRRASLITAAAAYTIAVADDRLAGQIAAEVVSNAGGRLGHQLARGLEEMKRAARDALGAVYKKARGYIEAATLNERATLDSVLQLASDQAVFGKFLEAEKAAVTSLEMADLKALESHMRLTASVLGVPPAALKLTDLEKKAALVVPRPTAKVKEGGFAGYQPLIQKALTGLGQIEPVRPDPALMRVASEIQLLCNGRTSALDIKKMIDTEYRQETRLETVLDYLDVLKKAGLVTY